MKQLLLFCLLATSLPALAQRQVITVTGRSTTATVDNTGRDVRDLNVAHDIEVHIDPELIGSVESVELIDQNQQRVDTNHFSSGLPHPKIIGTEDTGISYNLIVKVRGRTSIEVNGIGASGKRGGDLGTARAKGLAGGAVAKEIANCDCTTGGDVTAEISTALTLCPDCNTQPKYVYNARCRTLYERDDKGNYNEADKMEFRYKNPFRVAVIHLNRALEDMKITAENQHFESQAPTLFGQVFGGSGTMVDALAKAYDTHGSTQLKDDRVKPLKEAVREFAAKMWTLQDERDKLYFPCCESKQTCKDVAKTPSASVFMYELTQLQRHHDQLNFDLAKEADVRKAAKGKLDGLEAKFDAAKTKAERDKLSAPRDAQKGVLDALPDPTVEKKELDALWTAFVQPTEADIRNLIIFNQNFLKDNYAYVTGKIRPTGNRMSLKIKLDSQDSIFLFKNHLRPASHIEEVYEGPVIGKWFFSFSSGPFLGFGGSLYESKYDFRRQPSFGGVVNDTSLYVLNATGHTNPPIGLAAFAHAERSGRGIGYGCAIGVGLTAESKPKLTYMLGPSLFFLGGLHQFALTAGVIAMQVDVLDKGLYPDYLTYKTAPSLSYSKQLRAGGFIALSYTLFTVSKDTPASNN